VRSRSRLLLEKYCKKRAPRYRVDLSESLFDSSHQDRFVLILDLHLTTAIDLINGDLRIVGIGIRVVVFGLLPDLSVVELEYCFAFPSVKIARDVGFDGGRASKQASKEFVLRMTWAMSAATADWLKCYTP